MLPGGGGRPAAVFLLVAAGMLLSCAWDPADSLLARRTERVQAFVRDLHERTGAPGLAAGAAIDGTIVWSGGFGLADVEHEILVTESTRFRVGSLSKLFTAAAVALLAQQGKLDLDAPVQRYVPEFPDKGQPVTTRQLTSHRSGVRHYRWDDTRPSTRHDDVIDALAFFKDDPLEFAPGSRFSYSSYGWVLVSAVVQRAAGQPFVEHMQTRVFSALGMSNTVPEENDPNLPHRATLYENGQPVTPDELSYVRAAGGFLSSVDDLLRFGSAFLPGSAVFEPGTLEMLFTAQSTSRGEPTRFGVGWIVDQLTDGTPVYHHTGTVTGGQAAILVNPKDRIVVAILANQSSRFSPTDCQQIACYLLGQRACPEITGEAGRRATREREVPALLGALGEWARGMESGDLDLVLPTLAADFRSPLWSGRDDLERALGDDGLAVDIEDIHIRSSGWEIGSVVRVEKVRIGADPPIPVVVGVVREHSGWRILTVERPD